MKKQTLDKFNKVVELTINKRLKSLSESSDYKKLFQDLALFWPDPDWVPEDIEVYNSFPGRWKINALKLLEKLRKEFPKLAADRKRSFESIIPGKKSLNEGPSVATEALRNLIDDYQMATEMLIDSKYGSVEINEFKKLYSNIAEKFEKQFRGVLVQMMRR